jgi:excisionase family DNA binding protein
MNKRKPSSVPTKESFEPLVDILTIAEYLGVPRKTIYKWVSDRINSKFPSYRIGRHLKFRFSEIEAWLKTSSLSVE